jgi:hypothetical protein
MMPALIIVTSAIADNSIAVKKSPKGIVSEATYAALIPAVAQARNSLIDFITVWKKLATPRKRKRSFITIDGNLVSSGTNRDSKSGSKHIIGGEKNIKRRKACEAKARNKSNKIKE